MKTAGIIAEYNPFHNGHAYHIAETRRQTGADFCLVVMSGNFVQRGAPALLDKYTRTRMALEAGADLVIELPAVAALSSAESFACGAVTLLASLGAVTDLSFGAEIKNDADAALLASAAALFAEEPDAYRELLAAHLKKGCSFPAARSAAAKEYFLSQGNDLSGRETLLEGPNNILAVEYLKTIRRYHYDLAPCLIPRAGSTYHEQDMQADFPSASAIRGYLLQNEALPASDPLRRTVPASVFEILSDPDIRRRFLCEDDFSSLLFYALTEHAHDLDRFGEKNRDLTLRLQNHLESFASWSRFASLLKTKNRTYTAISRHLAHILLGIRGKDLALAADCRFAPYARVLGFRENAAQLLSAVCAQSRIPVITNLSRQADSLTGEQRSLLETDLRAGELYSRVCYEKTGILTKNEYRQPMICV